MREEDIKCDSTCKHRSPSEPAALKFIYLYSLMLFGIAFIMLLYSGVETGTKAELKVVTCGAGFAIAVLSLTMLVGAKRETPGK